MNIVITKQQLKALQDKRGQLDTDANRVFKGVVGRIHMPEKLYHLEVQHEDVDDVTGLERFSLSALISDKPKSPAPVANKPQLKERADGGKPDDNKIS